MKEITALKRKTFTSLLVGGKTTKKKEDLEKKIKKKERKW